MQPETNEQAGLLVPLQTVTTLSKYLALALFIVMPFIGGWIGYVYAPEKVVEINVPISTPVTSSNSPTAPEVSIPDTSSSTQAARDISVPDGWFIKNNEVFWVQNGYTGINAKIKGADPASFTPLSYSWAKDNNNLYGFQGKKAGPEIGTQPIDLSTVIAIDSRFLKDKDFVYLQTRLPEDPEYTFGYRALKEMDVNSFSSLDGGYVKDINAVYYEDFYSDSKMVKLTGVDSATFRLLGLCSQVEKSSAYYALDTRYVLVQDQFLEDVDAKTFSILGIYEETDGMYRMGAYAKDKNNVYVRCGEPLIGADVGTFEYVSDGFAKDKYRVYFSGEEEIGASPVSCSANNLAACKGVYKP